MADWYYIGHYGQLGPLTREQLDELVEGGVIARDTYVWRSGMTEWLPADRVPELADVFRRAEPMVAPPPPPPAGATYAPPVAQGFRPPEPPSYPSLAATPGFLAGYGGVLSDRSRALAGVLQLVVPGVGRIYLGYAAIGVMQLLLSLCGVGWIWSVVDGIVILTGGVRMDGYGRQLKD